MAAAPVNRDVVGSSRGGKRIRRACAPKEGGDVKIICVSCGHKVDLGDSYDDYAGQVKCVACTALLEIKTEDGSLRSVAVVRELTTPRSTTVP